MNNKKIDNFLHTYRARAKRTYIRMPKPISYDFDDFKKDYFNTYLHVEETPAVELSIPEEDFRKIIDKVSIADELEVRWGPQVHQILDEAFRVTSANTHEQRIRRNNPSVQLAWEKYQMLLKIAGE